MFRTGAHKNFSRSGTETPSCLFDISIIPFASITPLGFGIQIIKHWPDPPEGAGASVVNFTLTILWSGK